MGRRRATRWMMPMALAISLLSGSMAAWAVGESASYDPLAVDDSAPVRLDLVVRDGARSRNIPILIYLPAGTGRGPVVLFSHGLGGSRQMGDYLGAHWARRGYAAVFLQHPGSDADLWQGRSRV